VRSGWPAPACRLLHHTHHKYNKEHTLSPFAGLAFNALDGILQVRAGRAAWCVPYVRAGMLPGRPALPRRPARVAAQPHERMRLHAALPAVLAIAALADINIKVVRSFGAWLQCAWPVVRSAPTPRWPPALQAIPYCYMLFIVPMHLLTHELLLFATGIWTANIHDNIDGRLRPAHA